MDVDEDESQMPIEEEEPLQPLSSKTAASKQLQKKAPRVPKQQPGLVIEGFSSDDEEPDTTTKRKTKKGQNSKTSSKKKAGHQAPSSEDESMNPSPGKKIYLSTYREMGALKLDANGRRGGHDDSDEDQEFEEEEDLFLRRMSPRKRAQVQEPSISPPVSSEEEDETLPSILPQYPGTQNPSSRHRIAILSRQNALLSGLLSTEDGGRLAKEIQEESEAQAQARLAATSSTNQSNDRGGRFGSNADGKQTWGGAKAANKAAAFAEKSGGPGPGKGKGRVWAVGREDGLLGKARRGMGDGLGTHLSDDEGDVGDSSKGKPMTAEQGRAALAARPAGSLIFKRMGRSGVDDAEDMGSSSIFPSRSHEEDDDVLEGSKTKSSSYTLAEDSGDEDWASDVEEDQWGWDDAGLEEDAGDVI